MANPYVWAGLNRATNDPTTIDQAIAEAITAHQDNPDAHLEAGQSLESHRAAEIIDHRAESVVNDKIKPNARAYVAIVDPTSDVDFDTIASAVEYAAGKGGGTILLMPGEHYIGTDIECPVSINFQGTDQETCIIRGGGATGGKITFVPDPVGDQRNFQIANICFQADDDIMMDADFFTESIDVTGSISDCRFIGRKTYLDFAMRSLYFQRCMFQLSPNYALFCAGEVHFNTCTSPFLSGGTGQRLLSYSRLQEAEFSVWITNCKFDGTASASLPIIDCTLVTDIVLLNSSVSAFGVPSITYAVVRITSCLIFLESGASINLLGQSSIITSSYFSGGTGNRIRLPAGSERNIVTGNIVGTTVTNSGTNNLVANNVTV